AEVLRIGNLFDEDERAAVPRADRVRLAVLEDVVAQADDERLAAGEAPRHPDDLGDAARLDLHLVRQVEVEEELAAVARHHVAVAEQVDELPGVLLARHDQHLAHADALQELERVVDHRPAADRQQVLVRDARQLLEPGRGAACGDQALHAGADATASTWPSGDVEARQQLAARRVAVRGTATADEQELALSAQHERVPVDVAAV